MDKVVKFSYCFIMLSCISIKDNSYTIKNIKKKENIVVLISNHWTIDSLDTLKNNLLEKQIIFNYSGHRFKNGKLDSLHIKVDFQDGYSGSASSYKSNFNKFGFVRNYDNSGEDFAIGYISLLDKK